MIVKLSLLFVLVALLVGCSATNVKTLPEKAVETCGEGQVAYVDADDGQFLCKPLPPTFRDDD